MYDQAEFFRPPHALEFALIEKLLSVDFQGAIELRQQLQGATVRTIDAEGSLEFKLQPLRPHAKVKGRIPVEGQYWDGSSYDPANILRPLVHLLIHVKSGYLLELEIYKDDGTTILRPPLAEELEILNR
jgi:hypothetical protein